MQRNRIKRRLRELWRTRLEQRPARLRLRARRSRPGLIEAADAQGSAWLGERVDERDREGGAHEGAEPGAPDALPRRRAWPARRPASTTRRCSQYASDCASQARPDQGLAQDRVATRSAATRGATGEWTTHDRRQPITPDRQHPRATSSTGSGRTATIGLPWAWAIVALTVIVRIALVPLTVKQIHSMQNLQRHAPEMKEIQRKYKGDRRR